MDVIAEIDWTPIILQIITTVGIVICTLISVIATIIARNIRKDIQTPSGDPIGQVMERTHEASVADVTLTTNRVVPNLDEMHDKVMNGHELSKWKRCLRIIFNQD